jgi:acyl carrier protein
MNITENKVDTYISKRSSVTKSLKGVLINQLNLPFKSEQIAEDTLLYGLGLGLDSIDTLEMVLGLEKEFGISFEENDMLAFRSVNSLVDAILEKTEIN